MVSRRGWRRWHAHAVRRIGRTMNFASRLKAVLSIRDLDPSAAVTEASLESRLRAYEVEDLAQVLARLSLLDSLQEVRRDADLRTSLLQLYFPSHRSEERRVGKECRSRL